MQKIFTQKIRFKNENGKNYPDWDEKKLGGVFNIKAGGDIDKLNFSKEKDVAHSYPVFANALSNNGLVGYSAEPNVGVAAVTVTGRGDVGHAVARKPSFSAVVRLLVLIPTEDCSTYFFECAINIRRTFVESTGVPQLTAPQLASYRITVPHFKEQQKIADFLTSIDDKIKLVEKELEQTKKYKQSLLQRMFV